MYTRIYVTLIFAIVSAVIMLMASMIDIIIKPIENQSWELFALGMIILFIIVFLGIFFPVKPPNFKDTD